MPYDLSNYLVIGVSSRALFDLSRENEIFETEGLEAYCQYQLEHENDILRPGTGFALIEAMLRINDLEPGVRHTEVVIVSRNSADTSLRISNSIDSHRLDITRAAFTGGEPVAKYLGAFDVDLFLSASEEDVQAAVESNVAAGLIYRDSVENVAQICSREGVEEVDCVVSGLPWASFSERQQSEFLDATLKVLKPGGQFLTFAYVHGTWLPPGRRFRKKLSHYFSEVVRSRIVWANLPPAYIYICRR